MPLTQHNATQHRIEFGGFNKKARAANNAQSLPHLQRREAGGGFPATRIRPTLYKSVHHEARRGEAAATARGGGGDDSRRIGR